MTALYRFSIACPKTTLLLAAVVAAATAPGITRLRLRTDGHALVPHDAPEIEEDRRIRLEFGVEDPIVVFIKSDDPRGIFNTPTLELVRDLTYELRSIEGIDPSDVVSLETEKGDRVRPGTLFFNRFLEPMPDTPEALEQLRNDLRAVALYSGTLVSLDEKAAAVFVGVPAGMNRTQLYSTVQDVIAARGPRPEEIHVIGAPVAEALLGTHILEDLGVPAALLGHRLASEEATPLRIPRTLNELRRMISRHVGLVPIALALMSLVFLISFRNGTAVILPLLEVGACLIFVFGLMGWLDVPVYLTIAVTPVILGSIGVADEVHIFAVFRDLLRTRPLDSRADVVTAAMQEMCAPVVKTSATTTVGFLCFAFSPIRPVQMFGIFTGLGVVYCWIFSLTVVPAALVLMGSIGRRRTDQSSPAAVAPGPSAFERLAKVVRRLRFPLVATLFALIAVTPLGILRIKVQDSWIDGFAPESEFRRATQWFNEQFLGMHTLLIRVGVEPSAPIRGVISGSVIEHHTVRIPAPVDVDPASLVGRAITLRRVITPEATQAGALPRRYRDEWDTWIDGVQPVGDALEIALHRSHGSPKMGMSPRATENFDFAILPRWLMRPDALRRIADFRSFLDSRRAETVGGVLAPSDYLATTEFLIRGRKAGSREIPQDPDRIKWDWTQYGSVRGQARLRQAVNQDFTAGLISVFMKNANFMDTQRLLDAIRDYERSHLAPHGMHLSFAGDVAVSQTLIRAIVRTQTLSLFGSLVGILAITTFLGRSLAWGALCAVPCVVAVLLNFAVMGWTGMPLGVATSMFSSMMMGVGVDFAIHLLERYRRLQAQGMDSNVALADSLRVAGPPIVIDALGVAIGFGALMLSQVPANARLGGLVVLGMVTCPIVTLVLLPALLSLKRRRAVVPAADSAAIEG